MGSNPNSGAFFDLCTKCLTYLNGQKIYTLKLIQKLSENIKTKKKVDKMNKPDMDEFYESIGKEMYARKNRVRNIIGDSHWGEEGKYKEILLKKMIQRYLPQDLSIGTGFIALKTNESIHRTSQIDLILYKNSYPPLFREEDFVILHPEPICAIIEVKTNIRNSKKKWKKFLKKPQEMLLKYYGIRKNFILQYISSMVFSHTIRKCTTRLFWRHIKITGMRY